VIDPNTRDTREVKIVAERLDAVGTVILTQAATARADQYRLFGNVQGYGSVEFKSPHGRAVVWVIGASSGDFHRIRILDAKDSLIESLTYQDGRLIYTRGQTSWL
jgi:hypothetical protein